IQIAGAMCSAGTAQLDCSVLEEDWQRGQSYSAHWHSLSLVPQHHHRSVMVSRPHSLLRQWEARRLLQRCLSGAISQGPAAPATHRVSSPYQPASTPSTTGARAQQGGTHAQQEVWCVTMPKRAMVGASRGKEVPVETKVLRITKMPRAAGRELSHEAQRG
uniref:Uncharacterized protein n=1 Tax=Myripristis murdjan TaxID=586833 RepID=A0A668AV76_9TELE